MPGPFKEYVLGCASQILPHAEYALVEAERGAVQVSARRVAVDKSALLRAARASDNPICRMPEQQYA